MSSGATRHKLCITHETEMSPPSRNKGRFSGNGSGGEPGWHRCLTFVALLHDLSNTEKKLAVFTYQSLARISNTAIETLGSITGQDSPA